MTLLKHMVENTSLYRIVLATALFTVLAGCEKQEPQLDAAAMAAASGAYRSCAACHGARGMGNKALQAPALVNLEQDYLRRQLNHFRSGIRGRHPKDQWGQQMSAQASLLKDETAVQTVVMQIDTFENLSPAATFEADIERGKGLYDATCGACHGPNAEGITLLNAPSLRGIDDWYLVRQYQNFGDGIRGTHEDDKYGQQMQRMGQVLKSEEDIRSVAAWLLSLGVDD